MTTTQEGTAPAGAAPSAGPADHVPGGPGRFGWIFAAVWLFFLYQPFGAAWTSRVALPWKIAGLAAIVLFAVGFIGYLVPSENVMQLLGPALALLALMGGIFVPLDVLSDTPQTLAKFTPAYGVGALARAALVDDHVNLGAIVNVVVWTALFAAGAVWRFRRDTARV